MTIFVEMSCVPEVCALGLPEVVLFLGLYPVFLSVFHYSWLNVCVVWLQQLKHALGPDKPGLAGNGRVSWCRWAAGHTLSDGGGDCCRSVTLQSRILTGCNISVNIVWSAFMLKLLHEKHKIILFLFDYPMYFNYYMKWECWMAHVFVVFLLC